MTDIQQALSELHLIRHQIARGTQFRGYGPGSIAFSGCLAIMVAWSEIRWGGGLAHDTTMNLAIWVCVAAVSVCLTSVETWLRARRMHLGLAQQMLHAAVEHFLPSLVAGVLLTVVLIRVAPGDCWLLPGIWELVFSLGIFASCRFLPRQMFVVGVWYLAAGLWSIAVASTTRSFLPWTMGIPFGAGQLLVAAVLRLCFEDTLEEA